MARQRIEAPPATPPLYGLVAGAPDIPNTPDDVWGAGWTFAPEGCGTAGRVAVDCRGSTPASRTPADNQDQIEGDPFLVWAADRCSTFGFAARDYRGRAERQLVASESFQIAEELWTGELATAEGLANRFLTDSSSDTVTSSPMAPVHGLAMLVGALGQCGHGQVGMIHLTPQLLILLAAESAIVREGSVWRTPMGHRVIADDGYDGSGPGGVPASATQWAYATSTIRVGRGPVEIPAPFDQAVDRDTNTVTVYAQRMARYEWTNHCCHLAAEIDVPVPLVGPPS